MKQKVLLDTGVLVAFVNQRENFSGLSEKL